MDDIKSIKDSMAQLNEEDNFVETNTIPIKQDIADAMVDGKWKKMGTDEIYRLIQYFCI